MCGRVSPDRQLGPLRPQPETLAGLGAEVAVRVVTDPALVGLEVADGALEAVRVARVALHRPATFAECPRHTVHLTACQLADLVVRIPQRTVDAAAVHERLPLRLVRPLLLLDPVRTQAQVEGRLPRRPTLRAVRQVVVLGVLGRGPAYVLTEVADLPGVALDGVAVSAQRLDPLADGLASALGPDLAERSLVRALELGQVDPRPCVATASARHADDAGDLLDAGIGRADLAERARPALTAGHAPAEDAAGEVPVDSQAVPADAARAGTGVLEPAQRHAVGLVCPPRDVAKRSHLRLRPLLARAATVPRCAVAVPGFDGDRVVVAFEVGRRLHSRAGVLLDRPIGADVEVARGRAGVGHHRVERRRVGDGGVEDDAVMRGHSRAHADGISGDGFTDNSRHPSHS